MMTNDERRERNDGNAEQTFVKKLIARWEQNIILYYKIKRPHIYVTSAYVCKIFFNYCMYIPFVYVSLFAIHYRYIYLKSFVFFLLRRIVCHFFPNTAIPSRGAIIFRTGSRFFLFSCVFFFFTTGLGERIARRVRGREGRSYRNIRG